MVRKRVVSSSKIPSLSPSQTMTSSTSDESASPQRSKTCSLLWVTIAYVVSLGAAFAYLHLTDGKLLLQSFIADVVATVFIFIFSRLLSNSSVYDAYWSVIPPFLYLYWWLMGSNNGSQLRVLFLAIGLVYWAIRLTGNWATYWPGLHHEDWRYPMLRKQTAPFGYIVDFLGIHLFPTAQVFAAMVPAYCVVELSDEGEVWWLDFVAFYLSLAAPTLQLIADVQMHRFIDTRREGEIMTRGLWGWSRHPNYLGELTLWFSLYLFGVAAYPQGWWWMCGGFLSMLAMFLGASIPMMEKRSLERRPGYQKVIDTVPMLLLWPPSSSEE